VSTDGARVFSGVDQLRRAVGETLGTGPWLTVDPDRIDAFADATNDHHHGIHVDRDRAAAGPDGATVAPEYLVLSLVPRLGADIYRVDGVRMGINYGLDRVRFPRRATAGSRIRATATLASVEDSGAGVRAVVTYVVEVEGRDEPACIAETVRVLLP
jgi:acyl dehydratase